MTGSILILGGSGGIGSALARRLSAEGHTVHLAARDRERLQSLAEELACGVSVIDVLKPGALESAIAAASVEGKLAGLAYCVDSIVLKPLQRTTAEDFLEAYRLNVVGAAEAIKLGRTALASGQGAALLFSSVAAARGFSNHSVIAAAKGGVEALTRSLAAELAPDIRVNCIAPSLTRTALAEPVIANEKMAQAIAAQHPLPRLGEADEQAALAAFLLSRDAGWITGQVMAVDGGRAGLETRH